MNENEIRKQMNEDYKLIPMSEITTEARLLAVSWVEGYEYQGMDIPGKQKLASDIMNYARRSSQQKLLSFREKLSAISPDEFLKNTHIVLDLFDETFGAEKPHQDL